MYNHRASWNFLRWTAIALVVQGCNVNGTTPKATIENGSVTGDKMAPNAIATGNIQDSAVSTPKIADGAVTAAKLDPTIAFGGTTGTFTGNVSVGGTLGVTGITSLANDLKVNTTKFVVTAATGNTTVAGTLGVSDTFSVTKADTSVAGNVFDISNSMTLTPAAATAATYYGAYNSILMNSNQNATGTLYGSNNIVNNANSGTMTLAYGSTSVVQQSGAGTITSAIGHLGEALNSNNGAFVTAIGLQGYAASSSTGTTTTGIGVYGSVVNTGTGTITTGYGLRSSLTNSGGGAVTTYHGLHMDDPGGGFAATRYNLYSAGSVYNYIAGRLGIQNVAPAYPLDVTGDINTTTILNVGGVNTCDNTGCIARSDRRLKDQIEPLHGSLDKVLKLEPVSYYFKDKKVYTDKQQVGFIAQEVEKIYPEVVKTDKNTGLKLLSYNNLLSPVVAAVKELYAKWFADHKLLEQQDVKLGQLERKIELENVALRAENKLLKDRLDKIEQALAATPVKAPAKKGRKLASKEE